MTPSHLLCCEQTHFTSRKPTAKEHSIEQCTMPGNPHENKKSSLWLQSILTDTQQSWKETKPLLYSFQVSWRHLRRPFLAAIWELIHSLLGRSTSQVVPPLLRSVHVPDNPPNMWNSHCGCMNHSVTMGTNGSLAIWLQSLWLLLQSVVWLWEMFQNSWGIYSKKNQYKTEQGRRADFLDMALSLTKVC